MDLHKSYSYINYDFKFEIKYQYYQWCIRHLEIIFSKLDDFESFSLATKEFFAKNWQLVQGTMLCPTAFRENITFAFLIDLAKICDEKNSLSLIMPGVNLDPISGHFPLLRSLNEGDIEELKSIFKPCSVRLKKILAEPAYNDLEMTDEIADLDRIFHESVQQISKEIIHSQNISKESWAQFNIILQKTNFFISQFKSHDDKINSSIEEDVLFINSQLSELSIKFFDSYNLQSLFHAHILSDNKQSLIPVVCLAADGFMKLPADSVFNPYDENYSCITEKEFLRLVQHSDRTRAFYDAITNASELLKHNSSNLYMQLNKLCKKLKSEDAHSGRGHQAQVGELAFVAITEFFDFYHGLSAAQISVIPPALQAAIDKLKEVSGEYRGDMHSRMETCAGSRREQIEYAMQGHDVLLAGITIGEESHQVRIQSVLKLRDDLRADLVDSFKWDEKGDIFYKEGRDNLFFNHELLESLEVEFNPNTFEHIISNLAKLEAEEIDILLDGHPKYVERIVTGIADLNNLAMLSYQLKPVQLHRALHYLAPSLKQRVVQRYQDFIALLGGHHNREKLNTLAFYLGNIFWAIQLREVDFVRVFLNQPDVNINVLTNNRAPLLSACELGCDAIVELLLNYEGVNVNFTNEQHTTPLMLASQRGHVTTVQLLVQHPEVDINLVDDLGSSALIMASQDGNHAIVAAILNCGREVQVNAIVNTYNTSSLLYACEREYSEVVTLLLSHPRIDVNLGDSIGTTPLIIVCNLENFEIFNLLLNHPDIDVNAAENDGTTALMLVAEIDHLEMAEALLHAPRINVNQTDGDGDTALMIACHHSSLGVFELLMQQPGININHVNQLGRSALSIACTHLLNIEIVDYLLEVDGIDVNQVDNDGNSPLMIACENSNDDIIISLLQMPGIDVNLADNQGNTPLMIACEKGDLDIVELLLEVEGIDINQQANDGTTALILACRNGDNLAIVQRLLQVEGIDINLTDEEGTTPLMTACEVGSSPDLVRFLLQNGDIDIYKVDIYEHTAMDYVSDNGQQEIFELFIQLNDEPTNKRSKTK